MSICMDRIAAVLAIGTANPPNIFYQNSYADFYFRITNSSHQLDLKEKFKRICDKSEIEKRHMFLTEEILNANPSLCSYDEPSLDARQNLVRKEVPALGMEAALKAISEWGQPKSSITHLIFCTSSSVAMPGSDCLLVKLLELNPSVKRIMLFLQGCYAGGTMLRLAKDIAENNKGARVLGVCSELNAIFFRGLSVSDPSSLIGPALFGDGAAAVIVGADPMPNIEKPSFQLARACQFLVPETDNVLVGQLLEVGLSFHLTKDLPNLLTSKIESCLIEAFEPFGITDWNSLFWVNHPGGPLVLRKIEKELNLSEEKLRDSRKVLKDYGNMSSGSVLFILDEVRKRSIKEGSSTTGHGIEWGVLVGLGPGLTIETVVLRSVPL